MSEQKVSGNATTEQQESNLKEQTTAGDENLTVNANADNEKTEKTARKKTVEEKLYSDDNTEVTAYKCPNCGGDAVFDAKEQKMHCLYCGSLFEIENNEKVTEKNLDELLSTAKVWDETEVYQCQSCGAKEILDKQEVASVQTSGELPEYPFPGGRIVENIPENRLQIFFEEKPVKEIREKLKHQGFRWTPSNGSWQCYRHFHILEWAQNEFQAGRIK